MDPDDIFAQLNHLLDEGDDFSGIVNKTGGRRNNYNRNNNRDRVHANGTNNPNSTISANREQAARVYRLLEGVPDDIKRRFQFDAEASWSITNIRVARDFARTLLALVLPLTKKAAATLTLTDAMACVGGNTIAFSEVFGHVNAIELDAGRARMLENNLRLFKCTNAVVYNGYAQNYLPTLDSDVVFFDPPWGVDYRKYATNTMKIYLSNAQGSRELFDDIAAGARDHAKFIAMKLPINYAVDDLVAAMLPAREIHREWHGKPNTSLLLVFSTI